MDTKRPKTSAFQNQLDSLNLSDDELLSMVKSRHVQSPSEVLDWVNSINELASELESEALKLAADEQKVDTSSVDGSVDTGLSGSASS